jgi:hypothetical protein
MHGERIESLDAERPEVTQIGGQNRQLPRLGDRGDGNIGEARVSALALSVIAHNPG